MTDQNNLKVVFSSSGGVDPEQLHALTQNLLDNLTAAGVTAEREHVAQSNRAGSEYKSDFSSLYSLIIPLLTSGAVTAVINALRATFSSAPKTLTATITINGRTLTFDAKNLDESELERLTALLTKEAPEWAA
jgi:hypothetical protein